MIKFRRWGEKPKKTLKTHNIDSHGLAFALLVTGKNKESHRMLMRLIGK